MINLILFGKIDCEDCKNTKDLITKLDLPFKYMDADTLDGRVELSYLDIGHIPALLVLDDANIIIRWEGAMPTERDLKEALGYESSSECSCDGSKKPTCSLCGVTSRKENTAGK